MKTWLTYFYKYVSNKNCPNSRIMIAIEDRSLTRDPGVFPGYDLGVLPSYDPDHSRRIVD